MSGAFRVNLLGNPGAPLFRACYLGRPQGIRIVGKQIYRIFALFCAEFAREGASTVTRMRTDWLKIR